MKTKIKFPVISYERREYFITQRCAYLGDSEIRSAVIEGRFVFAWNGELQSTVYMATFGVLESVRINPNGSRTYTITSEHGVEGLEYSNAVVLREEWCPEVALVDKFDNRYLRRWIGLQEVNGKILANITTDEDSCTSSAGVDPSKLILLDDCKVGLPEREEVQV